MANAIYILCALTSAICAWMLLRGYGQSRARLLFWSGLCFVGLSLNNILLVIDIRIGPVVDLSTIRTLPALAGVALLMYGLIWEAR